MRSRVQIADTYPYSQLPTFLTIIMNLSPEVQKGLATYLRTEGLKGFPSAYTPPRDPKIPWLDRVPFPVQEALAGALLGTLFVYGAPRFADQWRADPLPSLLTAGVGLVGYFSREWIRALADRRGHNIPRIMELAPSPDTFETILDTDLRYCVKMLKEIQNSLPIDFQASTIDPHDIHNAVQTFLTHYCGLPEIAMRRLKRHIIPWSRSTTGVLFREIVMGSMYTPSAIAHEMVHTHRVLRETDTAFVEVACLVSADNPILNWVGYMSWFDKLTWLLTRYSMKPNENIIQNLKLYGVDKDLQQSILNFKLGENIDPRRINTPKPTFDASQYTLGTNTQPLGLRLDQMDRTDRDYFLGPVQLLHAMRQKYNDTIPKVPTRR